MSSCEIGPRRPFSDETPARAADRQALRRRLVALRRALPQEAVERSSAAICATLASKFPELGERRVGFYWPIQNEPDLRPLLATWLAAGEPGFSPLLPVVLARDAKLVFRRWDPQSRLVADACGILAPGNESREEHPQALLIPVNGFDAAGYRLGYGGGFFDRTLAALQPRPLTIGVGFELARVDSIFPQAHDIRLDAIVTEAGVFTPAGR